MSVQQAEDSTAETLAHIKRVQDLLLDCIEDIAERAKIHDASKLFPPEKALFDTVPFRLKGVTYGSPEYKACLADLKPALDHHYANNRHHPEFHVRKVCIICFKTFPKNYAAQCDECTNGTFTEEFSVDGMNLIDVLEMLMDWKAASERHADGCIFRSIKVNTERFKLSPQLVSILTNTAREFGWTPNAGGAK